MKGHLSLLAITILSITSSANAADAGVAGPIKPQSDEQYCTTNGGKVETMIAKYSTSHGQILGYDEQFCTFEKDNGYIAIGLKTFSSVKPSIGATLIKKLPMLPSDSELWKGKFENPSLNVCKNIGGSSISFFVSGGGFTSAKGENDVCVFGDGSMVSAWSLIYMAANRTGYDVVKNNVHAEPLDIIMPQ